MKISVLKNGIAPFSVLCATVLFSLPGKTHAELVMHPKEVGASIDFGQLQSGQLQGGQASDTGMVLTRTGVYLTTSGVYDRKLDIRLTIGGLFWYAQPQSAVYGERNIRFGPGIGQAQGIYSFGSPDNPFATLEFGLFSNKYNPDATNLGEYLYRSGTYPGYIWTGGWSLMNSASYMAQGVKFTLPTFGGKVTHDFTLFFERDIEPTNDLSPGYVLTVKPAPFLEFGGGVVWAHALSLNPSKLTPKIGNSDTTINAYSKITKLPIKLATNSYRIDSLRYTSDTVASVRASDSLIWNQDYLTLNTPKSQWGYYTFKGFKTMARASMDIGSLLKVDRIHVGDFKIYAEWALLGVQNQPFYYDHISERMPIMAGINIPTFGVLNKLSVEAEYHKSRFLNSINSPYYYNLPLPLNSVTDPDESNPANYTDAAVAANPKSYAKDDWHWSIYASRKVYESITLYGQVANDNLRLIDPEGKPSDHPITIRPKDWYYLVRLDFGLF